MLQLKVLPPVRTDKVSLFPPTHALYEMEHLGQFESKTLSLYSGVILGDWSMRNKCKGAIVIRLVTT